MSRINFSKVETPLRAKSMTLLPPPEINNLSIKQIGDYTIGEEIGSGAFGKVVLGKHILTGEKVAIKILDKMILNQTPEDYELVKQEISILKLVKHKYIVQLYEIMQTAQHIFIIMEYCEGKEIMDYILTKNRLNEMESLKYFHQLINTLFYLHSQNIAHRDVKIDNMLLDKNKDLKLVDFGLSTKYTDDNLLDQPCGTVVYAAPEVLEGKEYHGMLADVWSSGIVLYGMLVGFLPFSDKNDELNKQHVINGEINIPDFFPDSVKDLLNHMLDVDPMKRYTLQEIREHPWFNKVECILVPGIIIDYNIVPVDEKILNLCVTYNKNKDEVFDSVRNNKYDSNSALYYLIVKQLKNKGFKSVSDLCSDEFIDYILDEKNLVNPVQDPEQEQINIEDKTNYVTYIEEKKEEEIIIENNNDNVEIIQNKREKEKNENLNGIILKDINDNNEEIIENKKENELEKKPSKIEILEIEDEIIKEKIENGNKDNNKEDTHKRNKLSDLLNGSYSNNSNKEEKINDTNENNQIIYKENNLKNEENYQLENVDINNNLINKNIKENNLLNEKNNFMIPEKLEEEKENINIEKKTKIKEIVENRENEIEHKEREENEKEEKIIEENIISKEKIEEKKEVENKIEEKIEEEKVKEEKIKEEKEIEEKIIMEKDIEENDNENIIENDINNGIILEEKVNENNENYNLNVKEEADLGIKNLNKKEENKEREDIEEKEKIANNNIKEYIISKIEHVDIIIEERKQKENNLERNIIIKENENIEKRNSIKKTEENNRNKKDITENFKRANSHQIIINSKINLDNKIPSHKLTENKDLVKTRNFNRHNKEIINDIEVIGIKINKNEKILNIKNENKRYQKYNEKPIKPKLFQSKKNNNNIKNKNIYTNTNNKLFSIEKSNNVLNNLKNNQSKPRQVNKNKIFSGTEINNNKNKNIFKMSYNKDNNIVNDNKIENKKARKDSTNNINYSTRNPKKKLEFINSKPDLKSKQKINNKISQSNLKKRTSNQIFNNLNLNNKNNFISTATEFKIKNFNKNLPKNNQSTKNVKKINLQSKFDEIAKNKFPDRKDSNNNYENIRLSLNKELNIKDSNSKVNKLFSNKLNPKKHNNKKNYLKYNYSSLLPQNKKGFNNINTINNNILKSIISNELNEKNILKGKINSQKSQKRQNKSINNTLDKKKEQIININIEKNKMTKKRTKHLESSVIINRYKSPIAIRELSESPKQQYFNIKTRYARMPWKLKKKGIDEKIEPNIIYNKYINRLINPFNQNNSKIVNYKKYKKNSIRNSNEQKKLNKSLWTTNIMQIKIGNNNYCYNIYNPKRRNTNNIKNKDNSTRNTKNISKERFNSKNIKNKLENENKLFKKKKNKIIFPYTPNKNKQKNLNFFGNSLKLSNINSLSSMNFYSNNINKTENKMKNKSLFNSIKKTSENQKIIDEGYFTHKKYHHKHSNSVSTSILVNLKNKFSFNNQNDNKLFNPIDLSCLFFKFKKLSEFCDYIKTKLKKNSISYIQDKSNVFICNKNDYACKIEIVKMDNNSKNNKYENNVFYLKIYGPKERYKIKDVFKKFILSLD